MTTERIELCVFLFTFIVVMIRFIPSQKFFLTYDKSHFYKYKYIVNVFYDLIGIVLIPTGLNLLNKKFLDIFSLVLFFACILVFFVVAYFRYKIEKIYDKLTNNISFDNDSYIHSINNVGSQFMLRLCLIYLFYIPGNLIFNQFINKKYYIWFLIVYIAWTIIVITISQINKLSEIISMTIIRVRESNKNKLLLFLFSFLVMSFYEMSVDLKTNSSLVFLLINLLLAGLTVFLCQMTYSRHFSIFFDGKYKKIFKNIYHVYGNTKLKFYLPLLKNEKIFIKFIGYLTPLQLLKLRLNNNINDLQNLKGNNIFEIIHQEKDILSFEINMSHFSKYVEKDNKLNFLVFVDENDNLIYQGIIF